MNASTGRQAYTSPTVAPPSNGSSDMSWNHVETQSDADRLLETFGGFHDGCLHELHLWTGYSVNAEFMMTCATESGLGIRILVQRQGDSPSAIEMLFTGVRRLSVVDRVNYDSIIYSATLLVRDGLIYWATDDDWLPESPKADQTTFVSAQHLAWRDASDWMGDSFRVGLGPPAEPV